MQKQNNAKIITTQEGNLLVCFPIIDGKQWSTFFYVKPDGSPLHAAHTQTWNIAKNFWNSPIEALPTEIYPVVKKIAESIVDILKNKNDFPDWKEAIRELFPNSKNKEVPPAEPDELVWEDKKEKQTITLPTSLKEMKQ